MRILRLIMVLVAGLLSGCITTDTPNTRFYVLNPLEPDAGQVVGDGEKGTLAVEVASLRLPQYLERPQIVTRSGKNRLELAEYHQWGGNIRKNMVRVMAKNLSQILATPNIAISPHRPSTPPDYRVELEVMQFERDPDDRVRLTAQWRITGGKGRLDLVTRITDLSSPVVQPAQDLDATVSAMSQLFGELSRIIGQAILEHAGS